VGGHPLPRLWLMTSRHRDPFAPKETTFWAKLVSPSRLQQRPIWFLRHNMYESLYHLTPSVKLSRHDLTNEWDRAYALLQQGFSLDASRCSEQAKSSPTSSAWTHLMAQQGINCRTLSAFPRALILPATPIIHFHLIISILLKCAHTTQLPNRPLTVPSVELLNSQLAENKPLPALRSCW